jgi:hypothetical protein
LAIRVARVTPFVITKAPSDPLQTQIGGMPTSVGAEDDLLIFEMAGWIRKKVIDVRDDLSEVPLRHPVMVADNKSEVKKDFHAL